MSWFPNAVAGAHTGALLCGRARHCTARYKMVTTCYTGHLSCLGVFMEGRRSIFEKRFLCCTRANTLVGLSLCARDVHWQWQGCHWLAVYLL